MIQCLNKAVCWLVGHDIHLRIHHPQGRDYYETILQAICERCLESYGTRKSSIHEPKSRTEAWLESILPERNKKRMYKKATEMYG